jgi:hypothetical protein
MTKELVFETEGLDEAQYVAYSQGVLDCLDALGIDYEYDEMTPDLKEFRVLLSKKEE